MSKYLRSCLPPAIFSWKLDDRKRVSFPHFLLHSTHRCSSCTTSFSSSPSFSSLEALFLFSRLHQSSDLQTNKKFSISSRKINTSETSKTDSLESLLSFYSRWRVFFCNTSQIQIIQNPKYSKCIQMYFKQCLILIISYALSFWRHFVAKIVTWLCFFGAKISKNMWDFYLDSQTLC